jgi:hypothetical protein
MLRLAHMAYLRLIVGSILAIAADASQTVTNYPSPDHSSQCRP